MALTLRPSDEQQKILEQCQALVGENTISKAIYKALSEYIELRERHARLELEHKNVRSRLSVFEEAVCDYKQSLERLTKLV